MYDIDGHELIDFMNNFTSLIHGRYAAESNKAFFEKRPADWVAIDPTKPPQFGKRNANPFGNS